MGYDQNNASEIKYLKVNLIKCIKDNNTIEALSLPKTVEGKYYFKTLGSRLAITDHGNQWYLYAGRNVYFVDGSNNRVQNNKIPLLASGNIIRLVCDNVYYIIYCEYIHDEDLIFVPYYFENHKIVTIGRNREMCSIVYENPVVSNVHAKLVRNDNVWTITDNNSSNGTFVNNVGIDTKDLNVGDEIYIMGLRIIIGVNFISINNYNNRISISDYSIRHITGNEALSSAFGKPTGAAGENFFDRLPRKGYEIKKKEINIEAPPPSMESNLASTLISMGSPLAMGGRALMTGNAFSAVTSSLFPLVRQAFSEKDRKEYEKQRKEKYEEYLNFKSKEIHDLIGIEQKQLNRIYPPLSILADKNTILHFAERRMRDSDNLVVRAGTGDYPVIADFKYPDRHFEMDEDELTNEMFALAEKPALLKNVPVTVDLEKDYITSIDGDRDMVLSFVRNMILYLAYTHAYAELKIVLLVSKEESRYFSFLRFFPHLFDETMSIRFLAEEETQIQNISEFLSKIWADKMAAGGDNKKSTGYVIFSLNKDFANRIEVLNEILASTEYMGISVVSACGSPVKETKKLVRLGKELSFVADYSGEDAPDVKFDPDFLTDEQIFDLSAEISRKKMHAAGGQSALPSAVSFLEMYRVGMVEHLNPLKRWTDSNPVRSLAVPVGIGSDGNLITLDLHEKHHGPHGLIAGTTGSGKSEFIITYILSLAVNFSPDEVSFVLIDYKGGGLADAFVNPEKGIYLPHVSATITNLSVDSIQRSLISIHSELLRRQEIFKNAKTALGEGTMDIYDYQKYFRAGKVKEPLPHLFIISDEFAELKKQQPEFMDELISTARIGRSLGVHLILATQKPNGVVNDQIWSNTKFRVCLKVQSKADSDDMLKRPEAADLKQTGRFYLQVGYNDVFELGQSGWCGAEYVPSEEGYVDTNTNIVFIDGAGQTILNKKVSTDKAVSAGKQINSIVRYISDLAARENIKPHLLWIDPLPNTIDIMDIPHANADNNPYSVCVGVIDDPKKQSQHYLYIDFKSFNHLLLCGASGSGKSSFLTTALMSLLVKNSPKKLNMYLVDFSGGPLSLFKNMPHCGAYLTEENEVEFFRLTNMIGEIIAERKKLFAEAGVTTFDAYVAKKELPMILVVIDNYGNLNQFKNGQGFIIGFHELLRQANGYGVKFIMTTLHYNDVAMKSHLEINYHIALQAKDKYAYSDILAAKCEFAPPVTPGRGMCIYNNQALEWQLAIFDSKLDDAARKHNCEQRLRGLAAKYTDRCERVLSVADEKETFEQFCADMKADGFALGYDRTTMNKIRMPMKQLYSLSVFFGNPAGIAPVMKNLIYSAKRNGAEFLAVPRKKQSVLKPDLFGGAKVDFIPSGSEQLANLVNALNNAVQQRIELADEYGRVNDLQLTADNRVELAGKYMESRTKPLFVLLESFNDIFTGVPAELVPPLTKFISATKGYNIFFIAGFYPEEFDSLMSNSLVKVFNPDKIFLLFGGRYDKQILDVSIPGEYRKITVTDKNYNKYVMHYDGGWHPMLMPCGDINENTDTDPDMESIF